MSFQDKCLSCPIEQYAEGSILYLRMQNFLTYKDAYFYPGPGMNMIIGPNGSGKSAFVAGIVLALGAHQNLLDRSSQLSEFIRYGEAEANLEIVLKGPFNKKIVIFRNIKKSSSSYLLNGQTSTHKIISTLIQDSLQIQVDNLTQFIPQDKVRSLSLLEENELLLETERALKGSHFINHKKLILDYHSLKQKSNERFSLEKDLLHLRQEQNILEERRSRCTKIEKSLYRLSFLQRKRPWIVYNKVREEYLQKKEEKELLVKRLEDEISNPHFLLKKIQKKITKIDSIAKSLKYSPLPKDATHDANNEKTQELLTKILKNRTSYEECLKKEARRNTELSNRRSEIQEREKILKNLPIHSNIERIHQNEKSSFTDVLNNFINEVQSPLNSLLKPLEEERLSIEKKIHHLEHAKNAKNSQLNSLKDGHSNLSDKLSSKGSLLKAINVDAYKTWLFLEDIRAGNIKSPFKDRVVGPICMCTFFNLDKDGYLPHKYSPSIANYQIENIIGGDKIGFIVSSFEDYTILYDWAKENSLSLNSIVIKAESLRNAEAYLMDRTSSSSSSSSSSPSSSRLKPSSSLPSLDREKLKGLGFPLTLLDLISSDPWVMALFLERGLNLLPVSETPINDKLMQDWILSNKDTHVKGYIAKDTKVWFQFKYGEVVSSKNFLRQNRNAFLDMEPNILEKIISIESEIKTLSSSTFLPSSDEQHHKENISILTKKIDEIILKKRIINDDVQEYSKIFKSIQRRKEDLREEEREEEDVKSFLEKFKEEMRNVCIELSQHLISSPPSPPSNLPFLSDVLKKDLYIMELLNLNSHLNGHLSAETGKLDVLKRDISVYESLLEELKQRAKESLRKAEAGGPFENDDGNGDGNSDGNGDGNDDGNDDLETLDTKIAFLNAEIISFKDGGGQYLGESEIKDFEERKIKIQDMEANFLSLKSSHTEGWDSLRKLRNIWLNELKIEVDNINCNFQSLCRKINIIGQVCLSSSCSADARNGGLIADIPIEEDDFKGYSLKVLANYRGDPESLYSLSSTNHSGGERSLTSVLFLMSLQQLSKAPFRLVDEINQGMDADNERSAYSLMVKESQRSEGQYFLITPKLLTDLEYPEGMNVHCVFNGVGVSK